MLKIRLSRTGKKSQPNFRVVIQEHTSPIKGKFVEKVGYYRPSSTPKEFTINAERVKYWLSVGAQPSDSVAVLLKTEGIEGLEKFIAPRNKLKKKKKAVVEKPAAPVAQAPAEPAPAPVEAPAEPEPAPVEAPAEEAQAEEPKE